MASNIDDQERPSSWHILRKRRHSGDTSLFGTWRSRSTSTHDLRYCHPDSIEALNSTLASPPIDSEVNCNEHPPRKRRRRFLSLFSFRQHRKEDQQEQHHYLSCVPQCSAASVTNNRHYVNERSQQPTIRKRDVVKNKLKLKTRRQKEREERERLMKLVEMELGGLGTDTETEAGTEYIDLFSQYHNPSKGGNTSRNVGYDNLEDGLKEDIEEQSTVYEKSAYSKISLSHRRPECESHEDYYSRTTTAPETEYSTDKTRTISRYLPSPEPESESNYSMGSLRGEEKHSGSLEDYNPQGVQIYKEIEFQKNEQEESLNDIYRHLRPPMKINNKWV